MCLYIWNYSFIFSLGTFVKPQETGSRGNDSDFEQDSRCCVKVTAATSCSHRCSAMVAPPTSSSCKTSDCPCKLSDWLNQTNDP